MFECLAHPRFNGAKATSQFVALLNFKWVAQHVG
jgi:hypothetical protein